nr:MAG TPA: hypothetical protein [Caudoviricetes sp.]
MIKISKDLISKKHLKGVLFQCVKTSDLLKEQQK